MESQPSVTVPVAASPPFAGDGIRYRERRTGAMVTEPIYRAKFMRWSLEDPLGRSMLALFGSRWLYSAYYGFKQRLPGSRRRIAPFVAQFGVDLTEAEQPLEAFTCFDAFFTRRLKVGARPVDADPAVLVSPGDGKITVFPDLRDETVLPIKGAQLPIAVLLGSAAAAAPFQGGSAAVLRLSPADYHRFHFPADGDAGPTTALPGRLWSVNPLSMTYHPDTLCLNKRAVTLLTTPAFGRIALVEVGAVTVGTIVQTFRPGPVRKGQEKGTFRFGGSTIVMLFEPGAVRFDADLLADAAAGFEVQVLQGSGIGRVPAEGGGSVPDGQGGGDGQ